MAFSLWPGCARGHRQDTGGLMQPMPPAPGCPVPMSPHPLCPLLNLSPCPCPRVPCDCRMPTCPHNPPVSASPVCSLSATLCPHTHVPCLCPSKSAPCTTNPAFPTPVPQHPCLQCPCPLLSASRCLRDCVLPVRVPPCLCLLCLSPRVHVPCICAPPRPLYLRPTSVVPTFGPRYPCPQCLCLPLPCPRRVSVPRVCDSHAAVHVPVPTLPTCPRSQRAPRGAVLRLLPHAPPTALLGPAPIPGPAPLLRPRRSCAGPAPRGACARRCLSAPGLA